MTIFDRSTWNLTTEAQALFAARYCDVAVLGCGTYGVVLDARDCSGRRLAVKIPFEYGDEHVCPPVATVSSEALVLSLVSGDWFPEVFEVFEVVPGLPVVATSLITGGPLRDIFRACQFMDGKHFPILCEIIACAAKGLQQLHSVGVTHADVKPDNLIVTDERVAAKWVDLGLAYQYCMLRGDLGLAGTDAFMNLAPSKRFGTRMYLSPERIERAPPSPAADVCALGYIVLEALLGYLPWEQTPAATDAAARESFSAEEALAKCTSVPADVKQLVGAMAEQRPENRPRDLSEVAQLFSRHVLTPGVMRRDRTKLLRRFFAS